MKIAEVISIDGQQAVKLPDEFRLASGPVSIRKQGDAVILEPAKADCWPNGFFAAVRIEDPAFARPPQGETPPALTIESS